MFLCKVCKLNFPTTVALFEHFTLSHKVSQKSFLTCGLKDCSAQFSSWQRFEKHVSEIHCTPNTSSTSIKASVQSVCAGSSKDVDSDSDEIFYKCPYPNCVYKSYNKGTLRSHRTRCHFNCPLDEADKPVKDKEPAQAKITSDDPCTSKQDNASAQGSFEENYDIHVSHLQDQECENTSHGGNIGDREQSILKDFAHILLTLTSKFHVSDSTIQFIIDKYYLLLKTCSTLYKEKLLSEFESSGIDCTKLKPIINDMKDISVELHSPEGPMHSRYIRHKNYKSLFKYVSPVGYSLGLNQQNISRSYHYIPITESLKVLIEDDSVYSQCLEKEDEISRAKSTPPSVYRDVSDGSLFQTHQVFSTDPSTLQIILYQDDVELVNPLGSARGKYKLSAYYYTLGNLHPWSRCSVDQMQLVMYCCEKDVAYFGLPKVLSPMLTELKNLEKNGIEARGRHFKVHLLLLTGDNLGTHTVCGFTENFSASKYFCRYCEESRAEWEMRLKVELICDERDVDDSVESDSSDGSYASDVDDPEESISACTDEEVHVSDISDEHYRERQVALSPGVVKSTALLRTKESYIECVQQLEQSPQGVKGIVSDSCLNELETFHVVGATPPCLAHDCFEGVVSYDVLLALQRLSKKYKFSLEVVNRKIQSFQFLGKERNDKPAKIPLKGKRLGGHAVQNWILLRYLPLIVGDLVKDKNDIIWQMILKLIEIVRIVCSPVASREMLSSLQKLISQYLYIRSTEFNEKLRPKHHFLEHYPFLISVYGPLIRVSTLRFESKHTYAKNAHRSKRNFKNVTQTLATQHQLFQSALSVNTLFTNHPVMMDNISLESLPIQSVTYVSGILGEELLSTVAISEKVLFHGTEYSRGQVLVVSPGSIEMDLCKVEFLLMKGKALYAMSDEASCSSVDGNFEDDNDLHKQSNVSPSDTNNNEKEDGLEFIVKKLAPYLNAEVDPVTLKEKLTALGVASVQDLKHLEFSDMEGFMKPILFRKLLSTVTAEGSVNSADKQPISERNEARQICIYEPPVHLFSVKLKKKLEGPNRLQKQHLLTVVKIVADDLYDNYRTVSKEVTQKVAKVLFGKYQAALSGLFFKSHHDLSKRILFRYRYLRSVDRKHHGPPKSVPKQKRTMAVASLGIPSERALPNSLPEGENRESQEEKRVQLQLMASLADKNMEKIATLMNQTYATQRASISDLLNMEQLLELWPFIGKFTFLRRHFQYLMSCSESETTERMANIIPKVLQFMTAEADAKRKGNGQKISENIRDVLKSLKEETESAQRQYVAATLCIGHFLSQDMGLLFVHFEETSSFDEVQASPILPGDGKPIIAVLGTNLLTDTKNCFVCVDKRILYPEKLTPCTALLAVFMAYYVSGIRYPRKLSALLEFYQRQIFGIGLEEEDLADSGGKGLPPANMKYLGLMTKIEDYVAKWSRQQK